jgi:MYXO-CTERM domain-containing protein
VDDGFGVRNADDALFVTRDAGATWQELLRAGAKLYGFALSPAGDRVLAGFGDPRDVTIDTQALGIYSASVGIDTVSDFTHVTTEAVSCLRWTPRGLYVCATDFEVGFHLGFREDADLAGGLASFTQLLELPNVVGPLECPAGTTGALCAAEWPATCAAFSAACAGAAGSGAGTAGSPASGGASAAGGASSAGEPRDGNGCGCRVGPRSELAGWLSALLALGLAGARRSTSRATAASKGKRQS